MIGQIIGGALPLLRAQAESLMGDTCTIRRRTGQTVDPTTNQRVPAFTTVYTGPCRLRVESTQTQSRDVQGQLLTAQQSTLSLPYDTSAGVRVDDVAELAGAGVTLRIAGGFAQTYATARRFPVEQLA